MSRVRIKILGECVVEVDGVAQPVEHQNMAVLVRLVIAGGEAVTTDEIYRDAWRQHASNDPKNSVQVSIGHLRRALDPPDRARTRATNDATVLPLVYGKPSGYKLRLDRDQVDMWEFIDLFERAESMAGAEAIAGYKRALSLWRGRPFFNFLAYEFAQSAIAELDRMRAAAELRLAHACASGPAAAPSPQAALARAALPAPASLAMARVLASAVRRQLADDHFAGELRATPPFTLTWRAADVSLMDHHPDGLDGGGSLVPVLAAAGGRLVVLGAPGAGKTTLLVVLVQQLLAARRDEDPVPLRLSLAGWDGRNFRAWLVDQLIAHHYGLRSRVPADVGAGDWAQMLITAGLVVPILDGFDEMPASSQQSALKEISKGLDPDDGLILTSRAKDYRTAVYGGEGYPVRLTGAAGIELSDVDAEVAGPYLSKDSDERAAAVITQLGTSSPLGQAMRSALNVSLMRAALSPQSDRRSDELGETAEDIRAALLDEYLAIAYRRRLGRNRWTEQQAKRYLAYLAWTLDQQHTTELAWWRLREAKPRGPVGSVIGVMTGLTVAILVAAAGPLTAWLGGEPHKAVGLGSGVGVLIGLTVIAGARGWRGAQRMHGLAAGLGGSLVGGLLAGAADLVGIGKAAWPAGGVAAALAVGAAIGPVASVASAAVGGLLGGLVAGLAGTVGSGVAAGLVDGLGIGLAAGLTVALAGRREPTSKPRWRWIGVVGGCVCGVAVGLPTALVAGPVLGLAAAVVAGVAIGWITGKTDGGHDMAEPVSPAASLRHDAWAFTRYAGAAAIGSGLVAMFADGLDAVRINNMAVQFGMVAANGLVLGLVVAVVAGIVFGGLQSAWPAFAISRTWLALRGLLPFRLKEFLADAHERGLLRQIGPVYQFRHLEFQDRLARHHEATQLLRKPDRTRRR